MTEAELITSACAGNQDAFAGIVGAHQVAVYNLCYRMLHNATEAEDAAQEAFLRAFSQLHRYDPSRPFRTWLLSIASHHCIDLLRRRHVQYLSIDDELLLIHPALREKRIGPEEAALRGEEHRRIQALLDGLAPANRNAVLMHYWYGLSYEEIAATTGTTVSAVKSRLHRARLALGQMMDAGRTIGLPEHNLRSQAQAKGSSDVFRPLPV